MWFGNHSAEAKAQLWADETPISSELFGPERFAEHAASLAHSQAIADDHIRIYDVVRRLGDNAEALVSTYRQICEHVSAGHSITPAAEWLIDNFHLVEEQIRLTQADLPKSFYHQLPVLADGPFRGHPRVFGAAWAYVAHTDSNFHPVTLTQFVEAYQTVQPLAIAELWAMASCLRLVLIENLRRLSIRMNLARKQRHEADALADRVLDPNNAVDIADLTQAHSKPQTSFAVQLLHRLRGLDDARSAKMLEWLQAQVSAHHHLSLEQATTQEHQRQAAANVTVRNIIRSLRSIADANWESWFEGVSLADRKLRDSDIYRKMDFRSRNLYRDAIEELARGSQLSELVVVEKASNGSGSADAIGENLIGKNRAQFEAAIGFRPTLRAQAQRLLKRSGLIAYLLPIILLTLLWVLALGAIVSIAELPWPIWLMLIAAAVLPASEIGTAISNLLVAKTMNVGLLPTLGLRNGVPPEFRTLVVIPALLNSPQVVEELIDRLEEHFLATHEREVSFALVTDWVDAPAEHMADDQDMLQLATRLIAGLNEKHGQHFHLLHRKRVWNAPQAIWMGWERKRGKLHELNRLLRGAANTSFVFISSPLVSDIRFVITLDADTRLPRDAARKLIGKLAHPLNRPIVEQQSKRIVAGYAILQPRVTASLPVGNYGSYFQKLYSIGRGIDPYVFATSDAYQDLFGEGSYAGKGIYDIDAFETVLNGRFSENTILSHDLIESQFARSAYVSDVELVEEFPERHDVAAARMHRWVRGDWQLLPWIFSAGRFSSVSAVGRWKLIDNLRRSLLPLTQLLAFFLGWIFLPAHVAAAWTMALLMTGFVPTLLPIMVEAFHRAPGRGFKLQAKTLFDETAHALAVAAANLVLLADYAVLLSDAILRTLFRLTVSKRNLLEWTTAAQIRAAKPEGAIGTSFRMLGSVAVGILALCVAAYRGLLDGYWILPFSLAWILAPLIAYRMGTTLLVEDELKHDEPARLALRKTARRTWRYFEDFVTKDDHFLPPDNFQEDPKPVVARRTSPTNIGLYLLSIAAAHDFGWIGRGTAAAKIEMTLDSVKRLEKFRGHVLNWYDTKSLSPLEPRYVSSVDSGNLAGHLIALANCCDAWTVSPFDICVSAEGLEDIAGIIEEETASALRGLRDRILRRDTIKTELKRFRQVLAKLKLNPEVGTVRLVEVSVSANRLATAVESLVPADDTVNRPALAFWATALRRACEEHFADASRDSKAEDALVAKLRSLAGDCRELANTMEFGFLLDLDRGLLSIGYRVQDNLLDENCYDMLASEARLASFFAIAKADLPARHWFRLARSVTALPGGTALLSWSGSMFEYLMPSLIMRAPSGGLLDQTTQLIVQKQIDYAKLRGVPWGISESAFAARDKSFTYQYSNFGVPGLGLKRGLAADLVVAPYATALAAMVAPRRAAENFNALTKEGARGAYGFYESLDFTPTRLRPGQKRTLVRAYFAHHQGMTIASILNAVKAGDLRSKFHSEAEIRAADLLLQERAPRDVAFTAPTDAPMITAVEDVTPPLPRQADAFTGTVPVTHVLSNGSYAVMLTAAGGGFSSWNGISVTRWREDPTCDDFGQYFYLRDLDSGTIFSTGFKPVQQTARSYQATFFEHKAEIERTGQNWITKLECVVSSESDAEARRISVTNASPQKRRLEITSYCELALAKPAADASHPAFSKMFVVTEILQDRNAVIATRRKRSENDPDVWMAQFWVVENGKCRDFSFATDRATFLGSYGDVALPAALQNAGALSNTAGTVIDPVSALRCIADIPRGRQANIILWTVMARTRDALIEQIEHHARADSFDRASTLSWTQAQIQLRHLGIDVEEANTFQKILNHVLYANLALRSPEKAIAAGLGTQSDLWASGVSGDRPIVVLQIDSEEDLDVVRQILRAFEYWKLKCVAVDLVILNDRRSSYAQDLQLALQSLVQRVVATSSSPDGFVPGQAYLLRSDVMPPAAVQTLLAAARVVMYAQRGGLSQQMARIENESEQGKAVTVRRNKTISQPLPRQKAMPADLEFFNGRGGFAKGGREYVITPSADGKQRLPWINVIANPVFGFHASDSGLGYSWHGNAREFQISSWMNDPVANMPGEAIYVCDLESGDFLSPTFMPLRDDSGDYITRHGFGYSEFERKGSGLDIHLIQFASPQDNAKISRLRVKNTGSAKRALSLSYYAEWVLASLRQQSAAQLITEIDGETRALVARNRWSVNERSKIAYLDFSGVQKSWTGSRREFLGRYGTMRAPAGLTQARLSNRVGAGLDPCGTMQTDVMLPPGGDVEVTMMLGAASDDIQMRNAVKRLRQSNVQEMEQEARHFWDDTLGAVQVKTPDTAFNYMMNGWLLYQTLCCRMWARSGFYQTSGAYGFRDQLQDSMALLWARPDIAREHILRAAARQFVEGDVQHWWLPESGAGIRTRFSDDPVWLVYCASHYVKTTADHSILDNVIPFLEGPHLAEGETEAYFVPTISRQETTLYEHCALGIERGLRTGPHGLPLMGSGDWNDGMNKVGEKGKGESIWLGWFMVKTLAQFIELAQTRRDPRIESWKARRKDLVQSLEQHGWDGAWYRRAYFDDGTPLGSQGNTECRIDQIAQSWAAISRAANKNRTQQAMRSVEEYLIDADSKLAKLFSPPFDKSTPHPGYVMSYPPGLRENGGQYTHGAIWSVFAFSDMGEHEKAWNLFSMLNPINHSSTAQDAETYLVEPYVMAADIYSVEPHVGRGGWTWYTGAAGWMYRAGLEAILGIQRTGSHVLVRPRLPDAWSEAEVTIRHEGRFIAIVMRRSDRNRCDSSHAELLKTEQFNIDLVKAETRIEIEFAA